MSNKKILKKGETYALKGDKIGIVACSNAQLLSNKEKINELEKVLKDIGLNPILVSLYMKNIQFLVEVEKNVEKL